MIYRPRVTVIMPSLNVRDYIEECLESVRSQTIKEIEILCIDAGSTDGTYEYICRMSLIDERIKVIKSEIKSYGAQINMGIKLAHGEYIAIVETDDYIAKDMYEKLLVVAENNTNLEYVKSEYISYVELLSGERIFTANHPLDIQKMYGRQVCPSEYEKLMVRDCSIWKGIYKKNFLQENNIWARETSGAAYQDISFLMQVFVKSRSAVYIDEPLYYYCMSRITSSTNNYNSLNFCMGEYQYIYNTIIKYSNNQTLKNAFYCRLLKSFVYELKKILMLTGYDWKSVYVREPLKWFLKIVRKAVINEDIKLESICDKEILNQYIRIEKNIDNYIEALKMKNIEIEKAYLSLISSRFIVVFGAGTLGKKMLFELSKRDISVDAICDNSIILHGTRIGGINVCSLEDCIKDFDCATYIIASKRYEQEIEKQLKNENITSYYKMHELYAF